MSRRRRRRRPQAATAVGERYRWLGPQATLLFGVGAMLGLVLGGTPAAFFLFAIALFLIALSVSHMVGQRLRQRAAEQRQERATLGPPPASRGASERS